MSTLEERLRYYRMKVLMVKEGKAYPQEEAQAEQELLVFIEKQIAKQFSLEEVEEIREDVKQEAYKEIAERCKEYKGIDEQKPEWGSALTQWEIFNAGVEQMKHEILKSLTPPKNNE